MHTYNDNACADCGDLDGCHIPGKVKRSQAAAMYGQSYPLTICLVGSSRFKEDHLRVLKEQTLEGNIVLPMGLFGHVDPTIDMNGPVKLMLDELHLRKIDRADIVYVVNTRYPWCVACNQWASEACNVVCRKCLVDRPYIGESTRREIAYAQSLGKKIVYMEAM